MMTQKSYRYTALIIAIIIVSSGWILYLFLFKNSTPLPMVLDPPAGEIGSEERLQAPVKEADTSLVNLFFSDKENGSLVAEERHLPHSKDPVEFGKKIIEALIQGPREELMRTIPTGVELRALFITKEKTAFVDLSEAVRDNHPGGVQSELNTIYSIVNSLILNIPEIEQVKLLIGGKDEPVLCGHIDVRFPFKANMRIEQ